MFWGIRYHVLGSRTPTVECMQRRMGDGMPIAYVSRSPLQGFNLDPTDLLNIENRVSNRAKNCLKGDFGVTLGWHWCNTYIHRSRLNLCDSNFRLCVFRLSWLQRRYRTVSVRLYHWPTDISTTISSFTSKYVIIPLPRQDASHNIAATWRILIYSVASSV